MKDSDRLVAREKRGILRSPEKCRPHRGKHIEHVSVGCDGEHGLKKFPVRDIDQEIVHPQDVFESFRRRRKPPSAFHH